jgi:hypothetical protein
MFGIFDLIDICVGEKCSGINDALLDGCNTLNFNLPIARILWKIYWSGLSTGPTDIHEQLHVPARHARTSGNVKATQYVSSREVNTLHRE